MPHDINLREVYEFNAFDTGKHFLRVGKAGYLVRRQIGLRDVACYHRFGIKAEACQEHLHLFDRRVLRFVQHDERIVERSATHKSNRRDFNDVPLNILVQRVRWHHIVKRVV